MSCVDQNTRNHGSYAILYDHLCKLRARVSIRIKVKLIQLVQS